jgi:dCMP deaminase
MFGGTLYLVGVDAQTGQINPDTTPCEMCKRVIINAGITRVVIRKPNNTIDCIDPEMWYKGLTID